MLFKGRLSPELTSVEFEPSSKNGLFIIEDYFVPRGLMLARNISVLGIDPTLVRRLEEGEEAALAHLEEDCFKLVEGEEGVYEVQDSYKASAHLIDLKNPSAPSSKSVLGGFSRFRELAPVEAAVDLPTEDVLNRVH